MTRDEITRDKMARDELFKDQIDKSTKKSLRTRRLSAINMEMMKNKRDVKEAWEDTENVMSMAKLRKRPLTMQLHEFAQRAAKKQCRGPESPLYTATWPYFYIARVLGLGPYEFDENQSIVPSNINIIYSVIWICLYTYVIYFILLDFILLLATENKGILRYTEISKAGFNYGVATFDLFWCWITRKRVAEVWNGIQDYDEMVHELGYIRKERNTHIWVWSTLVVATTIYTTISLTGIYAFTQSWVDNVSYLIIYVGSAASVIKFSGIVMIVAQRFNHLNQILRKCMSAQSKWIIGTPTVDIRIIENLHNHMLVIAEDLNSIYSWPILLWLMNLCLHSVSNFYFIISWILETTFNLDLMSCLLSWIISFLAQLIFVNYVCHYASSQANCFRWIILGWKRQLFMRDRSMEIETSFHLMNRQLNFSAAGCFNVNLSLLKSIASSSTTYLVILLQFE